MKNVLQNFFSAIKKKKVKLAILIVLIFGIILLVDLIPPVAPQTIYIHVLKTDKITPEENASCKASVITPEYTSDGNSLGKVNHLIFDCYTQNCFDNNYGEGYYRLDTGLKNYRGQFEIKIICITSSGVSYTILNNTHIPCEITGNGESVRCTNLNV